MNIAQVPHPIYFLVSRTDERGRANLTAIKDERTGKRFTCVFISFQDAEEFMVANDLTLDSWKIWQALSPTCVQGRCYETLREGIYEAVINPPPVIRGQWRTLPVEQLTTWSWKAKEHLLVWVCYEAPPVPHEEAKQ